MNNRLTLNLGLRYDYNTVWATGPNQGQNFDVATQALLPPTRLHTARRKATWRLAWVSPGTRRQGKDRHSCIRRAFLQSDALQLCHDDQRARALQLQRQRLPGDLANPPLSINYPSPNPPLIAGTQNVNAFPQNPKDPVATNWLFGVQQEVAHNTILTVNYVGNNVHHMQAGVDFAALNANPANIFTQARQFSGFANENIFSDGLGSNYNALQVKLTRKVGRLTWRRTTRGLTKSTIWLTVLSPGFESPYTPTTIAAAGIGTCGTISLAARFTACPI